MISELQLIKGIPIEVDSFNVYPLTLDEIVSMGEEQYYRHLQILMFKKSDIDKEFINAELWDEFIKLDDFKLLLILMYQDELFKNAVLSSLSLFLKENVNFDAEYGLVVYREQDNFIITEDIFNKIKEVINQQNFIKKSDKKDDEFKPADDKARELIEKLNKFRKIKQDTEAEDALHLSDIISIVASLSPNYNFDTIWNLTIYQLYTVYTRMGMKDNYETQIYLLPHSSEKTDLKHWMSKIKNN